MKQTDSIKKAKSLASKDITLKMLILKPETSKKKKIIQHLNKNLLLNNQPNYSSTLL